MTYLTLRKPLGQRVKLKNGRKEHGTKQWKKENTVTRDEKLRTPSTLHHNKRQMAYGRHTVHEIDTFEIRGLIEVLLSQKRKRLHLLTPSLFYLNNFR